MKKIFLLALTMSVLFACKNGEKKDEQTNETMETVDSSAVVSDNSENSLDWAGVYEGTTPCADCEGIKTILELKNDKTYLLSQTYLGKPESENEFSQKGTFSWDKTGSKVILSTESDTLQLKVGENQLWMLDKSRNKISGELADLYILKKTVQ